MSPEEQYPEETYDVGLLPEPGGATDEWWQDAMRAELRRAHDFYTVYYQECIRQAQEEARREEREAAHGRVQALFDKMINPRACHAALLYHVRDDVLDAIRARSEA